MLFLELLALGMPVVSFAYPHNPIKRPSLRRDVQADNTVKVVGPEDYWYAYIYFLLLSELDEAFVHSLVMPR